MSWNVSLQSGYIIFEDALTDEKFDKLSAALADLDGRTDLLDMGFVWRDDTYEFAETGFTLGKSKTFKNYKNVLRFSYDYYTELDASGTDANVLNVLRSYGAIYLVEAVKWDGEHLEDGMIDMGIKAIDIVERLYTFYHKALGLNEDAVNKLKAYRRSYQGHYDDLIGLMKAKLYEVR